MTTNIFNRLATNCYYRTILDTFRVVKSLAVRWSNEVNIMQYLL